jgi:uronate dehydrogenase
VKRLLITGAAGSIGAVMRNGLRGQYHLRLTDRVPVTDLSGGECFVQGDVTDLVAMERIVDGVDAILHLAGFPSPAASWDDCFRVNMGGTYCLFEAAKRRGVRRVVFASSNHVTGAYEREGSYTRPDMPVRPDSLYGVSKAFGEDLGQYYVDQFGLQVVCLRLGSCRPDSAVVNRASDRILATWLSHRDAVQLVRCSLDADVDFGIYYGISANTGAYWDITNARSALGYVPEDDASRLAAPGSTSMQKDRPTHDSG